MLFVDSGMVFFPLVHSLSRRQCTRRLGAFVGPGQCQGRKSTGFWGEQQSFNNSNHITELHDNLPPSNVHFYKWRQCSREDAIYVLLLIILYIYHTFAKFMWNFFFSYKVIVFCLFSSFVPSLRGIYTHVICLFVRIVR